MSTVLTFLFSFSVFSFVSTHAQTVNITHAGAILTFDGSCLTATNDIDNTAVAIRPCDGNPGQRWDVSTSGPHIFDSGFAIIILSGTTECLDSVATNIQAEVPGIYTCGGRSDGSGGQASHQAFTYNTFIASTGPLVFVPRSGWENGGQGPGQVCLSAGQGSLVTTPCDPASPAPQQQFYLGSRTSSNPPNPAPPPVNSAPPAPGSPTSFSDASGASSTPGSSNISSSNPGALSNSSGVASARLPSGTLGHGASTILSPGSSVSSSVPGGVTGNTGATVSSNAKHSFIAIAIAVPVGFIVLLLILGFFIFRKCRSARREHEERMDVQIARPFLAPSVVSLSSQVSVDVKEARMSDDNDPSPKSLHTATTSIDTAQQESTSLSQMRHSGDQNMQSADINRIVSMVVARIDPSRPEDTQNHNTSPFQTAADTTSSFRPFSPDPPPPPPVESPLNTMSGNQSVNIDRILTVLAARVDPTYREHAALRDSRDLPPTYQTPPGYGG